jgi:hypothetical protein
MSLFTEVGDGIVDCIYKQQGHVDEAKTLIRGRMLIVVIHSLEAETP